LKTIKCEYVVITQASQGISIYSKDDIQHIRPTRPLDVAESVIGAGDCFCAFLAMSLARGMSVYESCDLAWHAGTIYVKNRYNKPLTTKDLYDYVDPTYNKINSLDEMKKARNYKLVFTNGCFDLLHAGHLNTLRFAKSLGDKLVVAVNSDDSVARLKSGRPIVNLENRMKMLASLDMVDYVVSFDEDTPHNLITQINPDIVVKGGDYREEDVVGYGLGPQVVLAPLIDGFSTTNIVEKIKSLI
jgi:D-beta-D-heptose 7-phosphate kinase/D-beta-D-heptose 1-phosphate adenosyltransferase